MRRRALLAALPSIALVTTLSGCLGDDDGAEFTEPTDPVGAYADALDTGDLDDVLVTFHPESELQTYTDESYEDDWQSSLDDIQSVSLDNVEIHEENEEEAILGTRFDILREHSQESPVGLMIVQSHEDDNWYITENPPVLPEE